jgi:para-aminobenzoate synthetase component 1
MTAAADTPLPLVLPLVQSDPLRLFAALATLPRPFLLDSAAARGDGRARFSYLGADPFQWIEADGGILRIDGLAVAGDPLLALRQALAPWRQPARPDLPPFQGGAVGYLGYELGGLIERLPAPPAPGLALPDLCFGLYDVVVALDHMAGTAMLLSTGWPETDPAARRARAGRRAQQFAARLAADPRHAPPPAGPLVEGWHQELGAAAHVAAVRRIIEYIRAGDVYQVNMTQRFLTRLRPGAGLWDVYRRLRAAAAAPFSAFLDLGQGRAIASASPERFLRLGPDGAIETRPIKGTRPRGPGPAEDRALAAELLASAKDHAENLMIVDLLRNDLSRVAGVGSVRVPALCALESFRTVHHLVSTVTARLRPGLDAVDLLRAAFPGGSVTGAPKIRAMEIIAELEPARRGPYCGAIAWLGWDGALDSSIVIRTLAAVGRDLVAQAGGGIVADSDPAAEYAETLVKARPLLQAADPGMAWPPAETLGDAA